MVASTDHASLLRAAINMIATSERRQVYGYGVSNIVVCNDMEFVPFARLPSVISRMNPTVVEVEGDSVNIEFLTVVGTYAFHVRKLDHEWALYRYNSGSGQKDHLASIPVDEAGGANQAPEVTSGLRPSKPQR